MNYDNVNAVNGVDTTDLLKLINRMEGGNVESGKEVEGQKTASLPLPVDQGQVVSHPSLGRYVDIWA